MFEHGSLGRPVLVALLVLATALSAEESTKRWESLNEGLRGQLDRDELQAALGTARKALELAPRAFGQGSEEVVVSTCNLAVVLDRLDRADEATRTWEQALSLSRRVREIDPILPAWIEEELGASYYAKGRYREARSLLESALQRRIKIHGNDGVELDSVLFALAHTELRLGETEPARTHLERLLALRVRTLGDSDPETREIRRELAGLPPRPAARPAPPAAPPVAPRPAPPAAPRPAPPATPPAAPPPPASTAEPPSPTAQLVAALRAAEHAEQTRRPEDLVEAIQLADAAIAAGSANPIAWFLKGNLYAQVTTSIEAEVIAEESLRHAIELDASLSRARVSLAMLLCRQMAYDEALGELERCVELDPGRIETPVLVTYVSACELDGQLDRGERFLAGLIAQHPERSSPLLARAILLADLGRSSESRALLESLIRLPQAAPEDLEHARKLLAAPSPGGQK